MTNRSDQTTNNAAARSTADIHAGAPILQVGVPIPQAKAAMIMLHGRGSSAEDIISLAPEFAIDNFVYFAPQAAGSTWYPNRFMMPRESNEPYLSSALRMVHKLLFSLEEKGFPPEKVILLGFSQGACLALEFAAQNPRRYGGVVALSGGLIGENLSSNHYVGSLAETPVFLGCSDIDFHIPLARVQESTKVMEHLEGSVTEKIYPKMGHTVNQDEIKHVQEIMARLTLTIQS